MGALFRPAPVVILPDSLSFLTVAQLHGCWGVEGRLDTLDGLDTTSGKPPRKPFWRSFPIWCPECPKCPTTTEDRSGD